MSHHSTKFNWNEINPGHLDLLFFLMEKLIAKEMSESTTEKEN